MDPGRFRNTQNHEMRKFGIFTFSDFSNRCINIGGEIVEVLLGISIWRTLFQFWSLFYLERNFQFGVSREFSTPIAMTATRSPNWVSAALRRSSNQIPRKIRNLKIRFFRSQLFFFKIWKVGIWWVGVGELSDNYGGIVFNVCRMYFCIFCNSDCFSQFLYFSVGPSAQRSRGGG